MQVYDSQKMLDKMFKVNDNYIAYLVKGLI